MAFISEENIQNNKDRYISLISSIKRPNARIQELIDYLSCTDFFVAPASAQYHMSCKGGLCQHSLNVYDNMIKLYSAVYNRADVDEETQDSIKIMSLLHDVSKISTYKETFRNEKVYSPTGEKSDNGGRYDWVAVAGYRKRDVKERFIFGNHEQNAEYIARCYIPLTLEESSGILHHMGGMSWDSAKDAIGEVYTEFPLALLLYMSDMISTYVSEKE